MEWETLGHVQVAEQGWRRVRWAAGLLGALWVAIFAPGLPPEVALHPRWLALGIFAAVVAIDVAARRIAHLRDVVAIRRLALLVVAGDAALCLAVLAAFADDPGDAAWAVLAVPVLEGGLLWGMAGATWTWAACTAAYVGLALAPMVAPVDLLAERAAARLAVALLIGLIGGAMGDALSTQRAALERARADWAHRATHDPLTGAPNRVLFGDRLRHALARSARDGKVAVLFVDCDDFKAINDRHGHGVGDRVLQQLTRRIAEAVRPGDTVGRLGGDEFVVLLEGLESDREAVAVAERLLERVIFPPLRTDDIDVTVSVTVGIAVAPTPQIDSEDLIAAADRAMYQAKQAGASRWALTRDV